MNTRSICMLIFLILTTYLPGISQDFSIYGYSKYMFSSTSYPGISSRLNDHLIHTRLNSRWFIQDNLTTAMECRLRSISGDSPAKFPGFRSTIQSAYEFGDLDVFLWDKHRSLGYAEIDRLYLEYNRNNLQITLGRQRVAWGTTLVWNITDLFNPMSVLEFDYEEKPGSDALRVQYFTGPVSRLELVIKPGEDKFGTTVAGLWATNAFEYDLYILGAYFQDRWTLGGAWAGAVLDGGFRGELKLIEAMSDCHNDLPNLYTKCPIPYYRDKGSIISATISVDYTFSNSFYVHTETLYNSNGLKENAGLYLPDAQRAGMLSPSRWSLFQEFAYDLTPLVRTSIFAICNPDDQSSVIVPMIDWSIITNWDLTLVGILADGKEYSEFGGYGSSGFVRIKFSF